MKEVIIIAAVANNNVIGHEGKIPWNIKEDLKRFRQLTLGYPVIMGRKTYESIPEKNRPLEGRINIVVSRTLERDFSGNPIIVNSLYEAVRKAKSISNVVYIAGGGEIYKQSMDLANKLEITRIYKDFFGDVFFPEIDERLWEIIKIERHNDYSFITYKRR
ncbi:MAG: dihydrofolate reductase [Candidatus Pacearchaeota archaeon]|nr:MAG: dihydrofolate reductase [Candidatus Pacearchaeota archaeon]